MNNQLELLKRATARHGQAAVARELGYSPSAINQALKGKYGGKLDNLLLKVSEIYGDESVMCPVLGEILLRRCGSERRKPFSSASPQRVKLYKLCKKCKKPGGNHDQR